MNVPPTLPEVGNCRHMTKATWVLGLATSLLASVAYADEAPAPPAPPVEAMPSDSPELEARYRAALELMFDGKLAVAATELEQIAALTVDPTRRATAGELAQAMRARLAIVVTPPSLAPPSAIVGPHDASEPTVANRSSRGGRYAYLASAGALGVGLYGPALTIAADSDSVKLSVGLYMLGAGGSFFAAYALTRDKPISWGVTDAWIHGATRGMWRGYSLLQVFRGDPDYSDPYEYEDPFRADFTSVALGSLAEGTAFALVADHLHASPGLTNALGKASDYGSLLALGLTATVADESEISLRMAAGTMLLGAGVGYGLGYAYAQHRDLTWGDSEAIRAGGIVGLVTAAVPLVIAEPDSSRAIAGTLVAGGVAGLVIGDRLVRDRDFSPGQGVIMEVSTLAGGLVGGGVGFLVSPDDNKTEPKVIAIGAALGAVAGFAIPYLGLDTSQPSAGGTPGAFQIVPAVSSEQRGLVVAGTF
ncbi:MAG: hypothetical protein SFX73_21165 [Kofleriaceae bacterium]|nr:hypothetical protein [Kofleriaceae bacterium]